MKTERVRIKIDKYERLRILADLTGHSIEFFVNRSIDLFMKQEAPVYEEKFREVRKTIESMERQPVRSAG